MKSPDWPSCPAIRRSVTSATVLMVALGLFAAPTRPLRADEPNQAGHWWGTVEAGGSQVKQSAPGYSDNNTRFYLGFAGGIAVNPYLLFGVEVSGWLIESSNLNDPAQGAGISQIFAVARIHPRKDLPLFIQVGGGSITEWNNAPAGSDRHGSGWEAGLGYEGKVSSHGAVTTFLRFGGGQMGDVKLDTVTIGVGYAWR